MLNRYNKSNEEYTKMLSIMIDNLKAFSNRNNIHITLEVDPIEKSDNSLLNINTIFGSNKSIEEVDNLIIIQNINEKKILEIKQNKYNGKLGSSEIYFYEECQIYEGSNKIVDIEVAYKKKSKLDVFMLIYLLILIACGSFMIYF